MKLIYKPSKIKFKSTPQNIEENDFAKIIVKEFFKHQKGIFSKLDKDKNYYIARNFYRRVKSRSLDIEFGEGVDSETEYKEMESTAFWINVIDFMYKYALPDQLKWYTQTINGAFGYYFKYYHRTKAILESKSAQSDERFLIADIRKLPKEEAINIFHCYVVKLYKFFKPEKCKIYLGNFYKYSKYITVLNNVPQIRQAVLDNNILLRGLLLQFKDALTEWVNIEKYRLDIIFDYEQYEKYCEIKGVEYAMEVTNKDLDDIVGDAVEKFVKVL